MAILIFYFSSFFSCLFKTQNIYYQRGIIPHFEGVSEVSLTQLPPNQTKKSLNLYGTPIHEILLITWHVLVKPKTTPFWPQSANNQLSFPHNISLRPPIIILLFLSCWGGPALCRSYASVMQLKVFCIFIVKPLFDLYFSKLHHIHVVIAWMKKLIALVEFQYSSDVIHLI